MFAKIVSAPPDAILGITDAYKNDPRTQKVNLGVGVYQDEKGITPTLRCVRDAEQRMLSTVTSKSYMPIQGSPAYGKYVRTLLFGSGHDLIDSGKAQTAHTPGGTGGLRVGADFIKDQNPGATVWVSNPTWANHKGIFAAAGLQVKEYPYYNPATHGLDFAAMKSALDNVPAGDIVLLHVSCHNPTGVDPTPEQWREIVASSASKGWLAFLDFAYQGFDSGVEQDAAPVVMFADAGCEFFVSSSFSKNFGLYQDRTGAFTLIGQDAAQVEAAFSHVRKVIRVNYSNPAAHGGHIVVTIMSDPNLHKIWLEELAGMRERIHSMRVAMVEGLKVRGVKRDFSYIAAQKGMFSFSGLDDKAVERLKSDFGIYVVKGGRINVAGINQSNLDYLCDSVAAIL